MSLLTSLFPVDKNKAVEDSLATEKSEGGTEALLIKQIAWEQQLLLPHYVIKLKQTGHKKKKKKLINPESIFMGIKTGSCNTRKKALY